MISDFGFRIPDFAIRPKPDERFGYVMRELEMPGFLLSGRCWFLTSEIRYPGHPVSGY